MARNVFRRRETEEESVTWTPKTAPVELDAEAPQSSRGVCRVSFRPSVSALAGVTCMVAEFFGSQVEAGIAASLSHVARDLVLDWVRPGLDESARVRTVLWQEPLCCELDVQVSFSAPADDPARVLALVAQLGRTTGRLSYRLLPSAVASVGAIGVRAEGRIVTELVPVSSAENLVTSTLRVVLRKSAPRSSALTEPARSRS
jgi:hypothetical protein